MLTAAALLVAASVTGYALWPVPAKAKFNERDFVLVGDLENRTNDPLLARTVQEALTIALQQSHYVNLVSRERVAEALKLMQKPAGRHRRVHRRSSCAAAKGSPRSSPARSRAAAR